MDSRSKNEEFAEKSGKGRNSRQREHRQHHNDTQLGIGFVQTVIVVHSYFSTTTLNRRYHTECSQVGEYVHQHIVNQRSHTLCRTCYNTQHNISCLRDRRESQKAFQILLTNSEQVTHCNGQYDQSPHDTLPDDRIEEEDFVKYQHQCKSSSPFRYNRQIRSHLSGSSLINIGCPTKV